MAAIAEDFDTCIGEVLRNLDQLHIADNTLVILHLRQWRCTEVLNGGKGDLGEGGIREPLIVRGPGIKGGTRSDTPVVSYDIMATVLDFVKPGFVLAQGVEGGSWKPLLLSGGKEPVKRPIDCFVWHQAVKVVHPQPAIRKGGYKLFCFWDTKEGLLYDLKNDLGETSDIAKQKPEIAAKLEAELKAHVRAGLGEQAFATLECGEFSSGRPKGKGKVK